MHNGSTEREKGGKNIFEEKNGWKLSEFCECINLHIQGAQDSNVGKYKKIDVQICHSKDVERKKIWKPQEKSDHIQGDPNKINS